MVTVHRNLVQATALLLEVVTAMSEEAPPRPKKLESKAKGYGKAARAKPLKKVAKAPAPVAVTAPEPKKRLGRPPTKPKASTPSVSVAAKVPTLAQRLRTVIAGDEVGIEEAIKRLKARGNGWVPNSTDLRAYISLALSTHKDDFVRVSRGIYRVSRVPRAKKGKKTKGKGTAGRETTAQAAAVPAEKVETKAVAAKPEKAVAAKPEKAVAAKPEKAEKASVAAKPEKAVAAKPEKAEKASVAAKPEKAEKAGKAKMRKTNGAGSDAHVGEANVLDSPWSP